MSDEFKIYDLEVSVVGDPKTFVCGHVVGIAFRVIGENLVFNENKQFSMYSLSAFLPILPVKQRPTHKNDWISTDELIACPDPYCGAKFKIARLGDHTFKHSDVTKTPLVKE